MTDTKTDSKTKLLNAALHVIRSKGYTATRIEDICEAAELTKGSFFHHFKSKEDLALQAAEHWSLITGGLFASASYHFLPDPLDRLLGYIDFRKALLRGDLPQFTCLVGTMVQEVYDTHPPLRDACDKSISDHAAHVEADIAEAIQLYGIQPDWTPESLALYTQAVIQGAFILAKAKGGPAIAASCIDHLHRYVELLFTQTQPRRAPMTTSQLQSTETPPVHLDPPSFKDGDAMLIAGLQGHFSNGTMGQIPTQWMRFTPYIGHIAGQVGRIAYGVCSLSPNGVDYLSGVQVTNSIGLPADFNVVSLPAQRYAVFAHHGHVSKLGETCDAIEHQWLSRSGYHHPKNSPNFFERYGEGFDPKTGTGDIEVWVPIS